MLVLRLPVSDLDFILNETRPLWDEMRNQRIFISGGTGFFGRWLLESFLHANRELQLNANATVLTRDPTAFASRSPHLATDPSISLLAGNVCNFDFPAEAFGYVIHAATDVVTSRSAERPLERYRNIADGTARMLELASAWGTCKFLLTSSGAVYGEQPAHITHISEDYKGAPDTLNPASAYGEGKRVSELMCAFYTQHTAIELKIARCFAFVGPGLALDANFAIGNFIRDIMRGVPIEISGDGTPMRSYLYAADLAIWLWTVLFRGPSMQAVNVGSEEAITIRDLAQTVAETLNRRIPVHVAKPVVEGAISQRYVPSTQLAQRTLQLRQTVSLADSIRRTADWHGFKSD